ncbi:MAG: metalloregulator ArsR/SmtB family transcription factor [Thermomicrobia bacterium]|nr:metalloregulator ArsR/SmtB family transcription factor [Thermomicrobia bacterium]
MATTATAVAPDIAALFDVKSETLSRFFRGLGDTTRLRILFLLLEEGRSVSELVRLLGSPQGRVSTHLACLRWCGFVVAEKNGRAVRYRIADPRIRPLLDLATTMMADNAQALASCLIVGEPADRKETA